MLFFLYSFRPSSTNSINSTGSSNHSGYAQELPLPPVGGDLSSRLSSDEGEVDGSEESEKLDCHYAAHHPRPLGVCLQLSWLLQMFDTDGILLMTERCCWVKLYF